MNAWLLECSRVGRHGRLKSALPGFFDYSYLICDFGVYGVEGGIGENVTAPISPV